jgi:predicted nucleic acid-binding protein
MSGSPPDVVVDASALIRGLTTSGTAGDWVDRIAAGAVGAMAPDLVYAEVANAAVTETRFGSGAVGLVDDVLELPLETKPVIGLARSAVQIALELGLSGYDAVYVALAEGLAVPLVTADRGLAAVYAPCELVA